MQRNFLVLTTSLLVALIFAAKPTFAADCTIIYGGGEVDCAKTTPTPQISPSSQISPTTSREAGSRSAGQTKGGQPIYNATTASKTPATGPETLGLISLIPMAAAGFFFRRKTNNRA